MLTTGLGLHESLFENLEREAVALDVHLGSGEPVFCTCCLEVHIAQVVLVAKDVAQDGIFLFARILDKSHGNTGNRFLHRNACVHQRQCAGADGGHG